MKNLIYRVSVLFGVIGFSIVFVVGFMNDVPLLVLMFRSTIGLGVFGLFGRYIAKVIIKVAIEEYAKEKDPNNENINY